MDLLKPTAWDLAQLFPSTDGPEIEAAFKDLDGMVTVFEAFRGEMKGGMSLDRFQAALDLLERITTAGSRLHGYADLAFAADTQNQKAQALLARVTMFGAELQNRTLFFELWWKGLDDAQAGPLLEAGGDRRYWLESLRRFRPFTLSEPEEKVINIKDVTGINALVTLYDAITNRYVFRITVNGREEKMTRGQLMVYAHHPDPGLRAAAYQELYRVYGDDGPVLGQMFQTMVRDFSSENIGLRGHEAPASVRHLDNDLPNAVVGSLLNVCRERGTLFQRFFRLKARMLGHPKLRRYDIYAPTAAGEKTYTFAEAWNLVRDAFADFDPRLADLAGRVIRDRRLDADVRSGKRDGAFCASLAPGDTPWVLQNFQGEARDVATLAHELGHAVHALLAADHSILTYHSALPLAENASTFGEMLLVDRLLAQETDPAVRRDLLFRQMDDAYATIGRQAFFSLFEEKAHAMVMAGATVDELAKEYQRNLDDQFGSAVEVAPEFQWEWVSIPHFYHVPFYVYAYSFGQLLVFALYREYRKDPQAFRPRYLDILKAGGAAAPMTVLSRAGLDISKADFWRGGFQVVEELVDKLEALV